MLKTISAGFLVLTLAGPAAAEEKRLTGAEITALLADRIMMGEESERSWRQIFQKNGVTYYAVGDAQTQGDWQVQGDLYCSRWQPNPTWACYAMAEDAGAYVFISEQGARTRAKLLK